MSTTVTETETETQPNHTLSMRGQPYEQDDDNISQESYSTVIGSSQAEPGHSSQDTSQKKDKSQEIHDSDADEEEPSPCGRCRKMVVRGDEALMCEICSRWFHIKCEKVTKGQYKNQASKSKSNFHWYCDGCDIVQSGLIREMTLLKIEQAQFKKRLEELEEKKVDKEEMQREVDKKANKEDVEKLEQRVTEIEGKQAASTGSSFVNEGASCSKSSEEHTEEVIKEIKEQDERKRNIVLFNLPESTTGDINDKAKHDKEEMKQLAKQCKVQISKDEMTRAVRLGKKQGDKPRPLLIELSKSSEDKKKMLFKNLRLLKDAPEKFKRVSVQNDLTEKQRKREKELREEAKKNEAETSGEATFKVRGPPWARKIVKVEKPRGNQ